MTDYDKNDLRFCERCMKFTYPRNGLCCGCNKEYTNGQPKPEENSMDEWKETYSPEMG